MMTKRHGLKPLLAALSLTLGSTAAHAQVLGGQFAGHSGVIGNVGGTLGSPVLNGGFAGRFDSTVSETLDAGATKLDRADRRAESTAKHAKREASRKTKPGRETASKRRHRDEPTAELMSTATSSTSVVADAPDDAGKLRQPAMPPVQGDAGGALDAAAKSDTSAPADVGAKAAWTGSAQASVD
jgi:hypothetical protein